MEGGVRERETKIDVNIFGGEREREWTGENIQNV